MGGKYLRWMAVFVIGLQVAGCYTDYGPIAAEPQPVLHPASVAARIQSGDLLKVVVYGEEALTGAYTVSPAGDITMPLIGNVVAAGRTKLELEQEITGRYGSSKLLQEPRVTVDVVSYRPIYILGEALRPGAYPFSSGLNVLTAVTLAGGFTYRASRNSVLIQHAGQTVWQEYPLSASVTIAPGDLIRIPERYF
jgi:protein involved in polysaccharide export with SLBB domain